IGGFIIVFSVFIRIMAVVGITDILTSLFAALLALIGYSTTLAPSLVSGLLELDLGTLAASQADAPLTQKVAIASAIIAWSGLSVHGQVASIVIESGIRMTPYMVGRLLHAVLAAIVTVLLLGPGQGFAKLLVIPASMSIAQTNSWGFWLTRVEQVSYQVVLILGIMLALSVAVHLARSIYYYVKR
ncbi:MAG: sporulation integral membrane protein YlbJ, partial [Sporomusa sp.]